MNIEMHDNEVVIELAGKKFKASLPEGFSAKVSRAMAKYQKESQHEGKLQEEHDSLVSEIGILRKEIHKTVFLGNRLHGKTEVREQLIKALTDQVEDLSTLEKYSEHINEQSDMVKSLTKVHDKVCEELKLLSPASREGDSETDTVATNPAPKRAPRLMAPKEEAEETATSTPTLAKSTPKSAPTPASSSKPARVMSPEARARIAAAQKKRWAAKRKTTKKAAK